MNADVRKARKFYSSVNKFKLKENLVLVEIEINLARFAFMQKILLLFLFSTSQISFLLCVFIHVVKRNDDNGEYIGRLCNFGKIEFRSQNHNCHGKSKINGNRWFYLSFPTIFFKHSM